MNYKEVTRTVNKKRWESNFKKQIAKKNDRFLYKFQFLKNTALNLEQKMITKSYEVN